MPNKDAQHVSFDEYLSTLPDTDDDEIRVIPIYSDDGSWITESESYVDILCCDDEVQAKEEHKISSNDSGNVTFKTACLDSGDCVVNAIACYPGEFICFHFIV